ncbi:hypothetical protein, partial [Aeromonas sp. 603404]|uniref:hypothetical protein n=1 Tax=Aeromonas sp. 603404 TaxID=2712047 RepID=UPI003BA3A5E6
MVGISGYLALSWQVKTKRWLFNTLKTQSPVVKPGFVLILVCKSVGLMDKTAHSKKAFPSGKAFKLVAERTGLEPA